MSQSWNSPANPLPTREEARPLLEAGWSEAAVREIAARAAVTIYTNRLSTLPALPPETWERFPDKWWVRVQNILGMRMAVPSADNGPFAINALDNLSGSDDLISIRSRGTFRRPFEKMDELRRQADQRYLAKKQELQAELEETERRINELQSQRQDGSSMMLTTEQRDEIGGIQIQAHAA